MRYISLFSGIEAASVAWAPLGFEPLALAEIEPFCCDLLRERFPGAPNLGDVCGVDWSEYRGKCDIIIGGSPCQAFSVAGRRKGLDDPRGRLMLEYARAVRDVGPRWVVWENVPGVLSQDAGEAFGALLGLLEDCGYSLAWRVLDAQFFGVPQRRRRVFLVGHRRAQCAAAVLFEPDSLRGDTRPSAEKRAELAARPGGRAGGPGIYGIAGNIEGRSAANGGNGLGFCDPDENGFYTLTATDRPGMACLAGAQANAALDEDMAGCLTARSSKDAPIVFKYSAGSAAGSAAVCEDGSTPTLTADWHAPAVFHREAIAIDLATTPKASEGVCHTLRRGGGGGSNDAVCDGSVIRRLTPTECERLQGFPDGWTQIPYRGKPAEACPDGPRYKALGNSMAVPVIRWLGERMQTVDEIEVEVYGRQQG